jgi:hypothetical protein
MGVLTAARYAELSRDSDFVMVANYFDIAHCRQLKRMSLGDRRGQEHSAAYSCKGRELFKG